MVVGVWGAILALSLDGVGAVVWAFSWCGDGAGVWASRLGRVLLEIQID